MRWLFCLVHIPSNIMDHLHNGTHQLWNPESQMYLVARLESYENDHGVYPYAECRFYVAI